MDDLKPLEADAVERWLKANRCCGDPNACDAACVDDEQTWARSLVARELDRLRGARQWI